MTTTDLDEDVLQELYMWVDQIQLSRPKKNITRDFSDGVLMAEVVRHYFPHFVDLHNFQPCNSSPEKKKNWQTLNWKVFKKLNFELSNDVIENIITNHAGTIERVLLLIRSKIDRFLFQQQHSQGGSDAPESEQDEYSGGYGKQHSPHGGPEAKKSMKKTTSMPNVAHQQGVVPRLVYEERMQECLAKDETIEILQAKIRRLEHLLHLKDVRIDDLNGRLDQTRPTGVNNPESHPSKRTLIPRMK